MDNLAEDFDIRPTEGIIPPVSASNVAVRFQSSKPGYTKKNLKLEVFDPDRITGVAQTESITVVAEAYDVSIDIHFPRSTEGGLDFGTSRVDDESKQTCLLRNKGKYEIGYRFDVDWKELSNCLSIIPVQGIVPPSEKPTTIQLVFKSGKEINIRDNMSIKCFIIEPSNNEVIGIVPVKVSAKAVYSKYAITPARDLSFGASVLGGKSTKTFSIDNTGEFDFKFSIQKAERYQNDTIKGETTRIKANEQSKPHNKKDVTKQADTLNVGPFLVYPASGVVQADTKQQIIVEFHAETPDNFEEFIEIDVSDRVPEEANEPIEYRLLGETCVPGINTADFMSIFEEHTVVKRMDQFMTMNNVFSEDDRCFTFGPLLVGTTSQARFKLHNPFKIGCEVTIAVKSRQKSVKLDANETLAFDCEPKKITLLPHEYQSVAVSFHPQALLSYSAVFEAGVESSSGDFKGKVLTFEIRGEGTLPHVVVDSPSVRTKTGAVLLKFRKLLCGLQQTIPVILRNDGILPAKVKFEWVSPENHEFHCDDVDTFHTVYPLESKTVQVTFAPKSVRKYEADLKVRTLDNSFEDVNIQLVGESFNEEFAFTSLPFEGENEIRFGCCRVGEVRQVKFQATNYSSDTMRFAWGGNTGDFVLSPSVMHVRPHESKEIVASLMPKSSVESIQSKAVCSVSKIRFPTTPPVSDWDDRLKIARWNEDKSKFAKKMLEPYPEPTYELVAQISDQTLLLQASADYPTFECDQPDIHFKGTMMFQSRSFKFPLRNTGKVPLIFKFAFEDEDGSSINTTDPTTFPFSVLPVSGTIEPGENSLITVRFAPKDVAEYSYRLLCLTPGISPSKQSFACYVYGISYRPLCHFELPDSDYLINRRSADTSKPALDASTRVIEFQTCGINSKAAKRFYIVNPTDMTYDFEWKCVDPTSAFPVFLCNTERGTIQGGKKFEISFEYTPDSVEIKVLPMR